MIRQATAVAATAFLLSPPALSQTGETLILMDRDEFLSGGAPSRSLPPLEAPLPEPTQALPPLQESTLPPEELPWKEMPSQKPLPLEIEAQVPSFPSQRPYPPSMEGAEEFPWMEAPPPSSEGLFMEGMEEIQPRTDSLSAVRTWRIPKGMTLREIVLGWARDSGWAMSYEAETDWPVVAPAETHGTFLEAVAFIAEGFRRNPPSPVIHAYVQNRVVVIRSSRR